MQLEPDKKRTGERTSRNKKLSSQQMHSAGAYKSEIEHFEEDRLVESNIVGFLSFPFFREKSITQEV